MRQLVSRPDPQSCYETTDSKMVHVVWRVRVNFAEQILWCDADISFDTNGIAHLDATDLVIESVMDGKLHNLTFELSSPDSSGDSQLTLQIPEAPPLVRIRYATSPHAKGLRWQKMNQTDTLFSRLFAGGNARDVRSFLPCQDTALVQFTAQIIFVTAEDVRTYLEASSGGRYVSGEGWATERYYVREALPSHAFAFVVRENDSR